MDRRPVSKFAAFSGAEGTASAANASAGISATGVEGQPIVLYCDLAVDPAREQEMLHYFHHDFKPAAEKFEGYIDLKLLKIRKVLQGRPPSPANVNYRFQLTYKSEEHRQRWIASDVHQKNWPLIENTVVNKDYVVLLTDSV